MISPNIIRTDDGFPGSCECNIAMTMKQEASKPGAEGRTGEPGMNGESVEAVFDYRGLAAYLEIPEGTLRH
jgi:hypothetical protein